MIYRLLADLILILHLTFVVFVVLGGMLVPRYPAMLWVHLPALFWGIMIQWSNGICPLTPLENYFRQLGGEAVYAKGFVEHWVATILYPENLTLELRYVLGLLLVVANVGVYAFVIIRRKTA